MSSSIRCKVTGCDFDDCGVCRRCGAERETHHDWKEAERKRPCYELKICDRCGTEKESPDHDWDSSTSPAGEIQMTCKRCGLAI
jgi:hypothetical protein